MTLSWENMEDKKKKNSEGPQESIEKDIFSYDDDDGDTPFWWAHGRPYSPCSKQPLLSTKTVKALADHFNYHPTSFLCCNCNYAHLESFLSILQVFWKNACSWCINISSLLCLLIIAGNEKDSWFVDKFCNCFCNQVLSSKIHHIWWSNTFDNLR